MNIFEYSDNNNKMSLLMFLILPVFVITSQYALLYCSKVKRGKCNPGTTWTGSFSFHLYIRSSFAHPSVYYIENDWIINRYFFSTMAISFIEFKKLLFKLWTYNLQFVIHKLACRVDTVANPLDMLMSTKFWNEKR